MKHLHTPVDESEMKMFGNRNVRILVALGSCVCAAASTAAQKTYGAPATAQGCTEYELIDVHGSGAGNYAFSAPGLAMKRKLEAVLTESFKAKTVPFPAAGGFGPLLGAAMKANGAYQKSVTRMKNWLRDTLITLEKDCPSTKVILSGHSQGAQAVGDVYQEQAWRQVIGVAMFGDPYFNHVDSSDWFAFNVHPHKRGRIENKLDGALAAPKPRKAFNSLFVISFCHQFDPICQAPLSNYVLLRYGWKQHNDYDQFGEPELAAVQLLLDNHYKVPQKEMKIPKLLRDKTKERGE